MSLKDKLEIGLKPDAPYREDNLPAMQKDDPDCLEGANPDTSAATEAARRRCDADESVGGAPVRRSAPVKRRGPRQIAIRAR